MEWEVPESGLGQMRWIPGVGGSYGPLHQDGDAETSTLCFPHKHAWSERARRRVKLRRLIISTADKYSMHGQVSPYWKNYGWAA